MVRLIVNKKIENNGELHFLVKSTIPMNFILAYKMIREKDNTISVSHFAKKYIPMNFNHAVVIFSPLKPKKDEKNTNYKS